MIGNPPRKGPELPKPRLETTLPEAGEKTRHIENARALARVKNIPVNLQVHDLTGENSSFVKLYETLLNPLNKDQENTLKAIVTPPPHAGAAPSHRDLTAANNLHTSISNLMAEHKNELDNLQTRFQLKIDNLNSAMAAKEDPEVKLQSIENLRIQHLKDLTTLQEEQLRDINNFYDDSTKQKYLKDVYNRPEENVDFNAIKSEQVKAAANKHEEQKSKLNADYNKAKDQQAEILAFIRQQTAAGWIKELQTEELSMKSGLTPGEHPEQVVLDPMEQVKTRHHNIIYVDSEGKTKQTISRGLFSSHSEGDANIRDQILYALAQPGCKSITISAKTQTWGQWLDGNGETSDDNKLLQRMWRIAKEIDPDLKVNGYKPTEKDEKWLREYRAEKLAESVGMERNTESSILSRLDALDNQISAKEGSIPKVVPNTPLGKIISGNESIAFDIEHQLNKIEQLRELYLKENSKAPLTPQQSEQLSTCIDNVNRHITALQDRNDSLKGHEKLTTKGHAAVAALEARADDLVDHYERINQDIPRPTALSLSS